MAEVAESINELAAALESSEGRERAFLLSVSHELRTPLTAVKGFGEALADGVSTDPQEAGRIIVAESGRLERLVADLLDLARLGADDFHLSPVEVDLVELVRVGRRRSGPPGARTWVSRSGPRSRRSAADAPPACWP